MYRIAVFDFLGRLLLYTVILFQCDVWQAGMCAAALELPALSDLQHDENFSVPIML